MRKSPTTEPKFPGQGSPNLENFRLTSNRFRVPGGIGIFAIAARFNHACAPVRNVRYAFDGEREVIKLTVCQDEVSAGTELLINYGGSPADLYTTYGFVCSCGGCSSLTEEDIRIMKELEYNW